MGMRGRWERFIVQSHDPEMIESKSARFEQAHDLDGRAFVLDLERGVGGDRAESIERLIEGKRRRGEIERGESGEQIVPRFDYLKLFAGQGAGAGPTGCVEQPRKIAAPGAGGLLGGKIGNHFFQACQHALQERATIGGV